MNKYKVKVQNLYDGSTSTVTVEADSFYTDRNSATFTVGKYIAGDPDLPQAVAYYGDVISIQKINDE